MGLNVRGLTDSKNQIGHSISGANHRGKKLIDDLFVHEKQPALESAGSWGKQLGMCRRLFVVQEHTVTDL
jgi:hypothetical protein